VTSFAKTDLDRLRTRLFEITRDAGLQLIAADSYGLIVHVDPPLALALGWRDDELVGRPLTTIIPRRLRDAHLIGISRFLATDAPTILERPLQLWISTRTGEELRVEHVITAIRIDSRWLFGAAIRAEGGLGGG
jgi:PAS domain S-box-containing protein